MKKTQLFGVAVATACGAALLAGCSSPKVRFTVIEPAAKITDVAKVGVLKLNVAADVKGSLAEAGAGAEVAGLVKQMTSAKLYSAGYIRTTDNIWGDSQGASKVHAYTETVGSRHGYTGVRTADDEEKATLELALDLTIDSKPVTRQRAFTLVDQAYDIDAKPGKLPIGKPRKPVIVQQSAPYTVYETVAKGTLTAKLTGPKGSDAPVPYANTFTITMPGDSVSSLSRPTLLKAVSAALDPAIDGVVADLSPHKGAPVECDVNGDGDEKAAILLANGAFPQVIDTVEALAKDKKVTAADWENEGLANEAMGDLASAKDSYQQALKLDKGAAGAQAGVKRIDAKLAAAKAVKKSGAKKDADTTFKK